MARKPKAPDTPDAPSPKTPAIIQPKSRMQWDALLKQVATNKWRRIRVRIQLREYLYAGQPRHLDAANAMLKARGLEDMIEAIPDDAAARAAAAEQVSEEGICQFHRRQGKDGIWFPTNNLKAMLKENWSVLGFRQAHLGSRVSIAEALFVYSVPPEGSPPVERDYIFLGKEPDGVHTSVCHSEIRGQKLASIKRNEFLNRPILEFEIAIAKEIEQKLPDESLAASLLHAAEHGLGASRSQGIGKFDIISMEDLGISDTAAA
jgi:hypothetical protein